MYFEERIRAETVGGDSGCGGGGISQWSQRDKFPRPIKIREILIGRPLLPERHLPTKVRIATQPGKNRIISKLGSIST
ncbi:hypothetical protein ACTXT7_001586 [Hymenolepis weldensis]